MLRLRRYIEENHGEEFVAPVEAGALWNSWSRLGAEQKDRVLTRYESILEKKTSVSLGLMRMLVELQASEPPEASPAEYYSPREHAPADPISRHALDPDSEIVRGVRRAFFQKPLPQAQHRIYAYDWASGQVIRTRELLAREERFEDAANGYAPLLDLAHAVALRELDAGQQRVLQQAFAHAYTDRGGGVYPGLTLYDAWRSRIEIEMPDVDTLGIYHDVSGDWETYKAPIPDIEHDQFYGILETYFHRVRRYRELRQALADHLLEGEPLDRQYLASRTNLHGFWASVKNDLAKARGQLPTDDDDRLWLGKRIEKDRKDSKSWDAGKKRRAMLAKDASLVRHALSEALAEEQ